MSKPEQCKGCPLYGAEGPVWGQGSVHSKLVILGQNPGPTEVEEGRPFAGKSGQVLDRALRAGGISRQESFVSNVVKCFVAPGKPVPPGAATSCRPLLDRELQALPHATTILTLGKEAFDAIAAPKKLNIVHNRKKSRGDRSYWLRGCPYQLPSRSTRQYTVVPTFHPSFVMRTGFTLGPVFDVDVAKAGRFSRGEVVVEKASFNYNPTEAEVREYVELILQSGEGGLDIETPESVLPVDEDELAERRYLPVGLIGLSAFRNHSLGVEPHQFDLLKPLFNVQDRVGGGVDRVPTLWVYNAGFDFYNLRQHYILDGVRQADAMMGFYLLWPDMLSKDIGTAMSLMTDLPFHKNLQNISPIEYNAADTYGVLELGQNILKTFHRIDEAQDRFKLPGNRTWVRQSLTQLFWNHLMPSIPVVGEWNVTGFPYNKELSDKYELELLMKLAKYEEWWSSHIPQFSWSSPKQLIEFFEMRGMKVPKRKRVNAKTKAITYTPSVDNAALESFVAAGNKTAGLVQQMRLMRKSSEFFNICDEDGRVRTRAKLHGQVGGRIQTVDYNMQTLPEEVGGTSPRDCIVPEDPSQDVVISADFSQIEFWIYAWYAQSKRALQIKESGEYLYGAFYEDIWGEPFFLPNSQRRKSDRDTARTPPWKLLVAKSWPLGFTYGRGVPNPADQGLPIDRNAAKRIYAKYHRDFPEFSSFHNHLKFTATRFGYLQTVFGRMRRFPNPDAQHNELLAFPGQTTAVDILIRNALLPLSKRLPLEFGERSHIYFTVHDSVITGVNCGLGGHFSLRRAIDAYDLVRECMESPIPEMDNYVIPAEVKIGPSWGQGLSIAKFKERYANYPNPTV